MKLPTLQQMLEFQATDPQLSGVDIPAMFNFYEKTAGKNHKGEKVWTNKEGKIYGNWKNMIYTRSHYEPPKLCGICQKPANKFQFREGKKFYLCPIHLPKETPTNPNPVITKDEEMVTQDKVQVQIKKLANSFKK